MANQALYNMDSSPLRISTSPFDGFPDMPCKISVLQKIPDEILLRIFSYTIRPEVWRTRDLRLIMLVSWKWRNIGEVLLFRDIRFGRLGDPCSSRGFGLSHPSTNSRLSKLLVVLEKNSRLCHYVRSFQIQFRTHGNCSIAFNNAARILRLCHAIRKVSLGSDTRQSSTGEANLIEAVRSLPLLENLYLSGMIGSNPSMIPDFNLPALKRITLHQHGWGHERADRELSPNSQQDLSAEYRTWNVSTFTISDSGSPFHVTAQNLQLPKQLESVTIHNMTQTRNIEQLQLLLDIHSESLIHIKLGAMRLEDERVPNFSHFFCLQNLTMRALEVLGVPSSEALRILLAPNLQTLVLSCSPEWPPATRDMRRPTRSIYWDDNHRFKPSHVSWFQSFATHKRLYYPNSKLETITLDYSMNLDFMHYHKYEFPTPWPWAEIDRACNAVALVRAGFVLAYTEPEVTKPDWDRRMRNRCMRQADRGVLNNDGAILKNYKKRRCGFRGTLEYQSDGW